MKFSIIIPTRNRQKTAIHAIESCILSRYKNIEIIVTDVSDNSSLKAQVESFNDDRIQYFHHSKALSMKDNWEFGVSQTNGEYVGIIGDDDALMPDGLSFASEVLTHSKSPVLHCRTPNYKWPDYSLLNRRNYIGLKFPTTVTETIKPQDRLRLAYEFKETHGTGPGIYHGLVSKTFLQKLKSKRGSYFVDEVPDFDSGFCTLLYTEKFLETSYPIFVSGQCASSNSGAMHIRSKNSIGLEKFASEASISMTQLMSEDFNKLVTNTAVIAGAMIRFLPEVNREISGKKIKINKQSLFDHVAKSVSDGYENTTFKVETALLKKIAKRWKVSPKTIPQKKLPTLGLLADKGHNKTAVLKTKPVKQICIDGNALGVKNIQDAIKVIESATIDWVILLNSLSLFKGITHPSREYIGGSLESIIQKLESNDEKTAIEKLEKNILANPVDAGSLLLLGALYFNQNNFDEAIPQLARSLSFEFNIKAFDAYFHSLINKNQIDFARQVVENYKDELGEINTQLTDHCMGIIEMKSGNYELAAEIFEKVTPGIDPSLYYYCAAYAKFLKGEALHADRLVREALSYNSSKSEYLSLQAKIEAHS